MAQPTDGVEQGGVPPAEVYADGTMVRDHEPEQHLSAEEYDPRGTLALLLIYFAILVVMWTYMYFVEFLGNGATVIG